ncbi:cytochrome [Mycobacterium sp. 852002-50816_SCH5313054-b]|uniref:cytochrome P450 n=1 Tax=Mycobacterium sp. 852002-50816_SCH5313054-b TaxID=1834092 RepID=UPI0008014618|nr:cytochrome P450 [Mycobacterium sp. 852002-50816_SCH5313054-b]OBF45773.1 cytochrome [Mycobacterium sp. 852002-50816_SCH5313054-b]
MTETSTATDIPDFPMTRAPGCPFAPPPEALELNADRQLSRVRIWDGSTPWLIHGYDAIRALFTDSRTSVDDRLPGYPHWNEGMLATVDKRPRSVFTSDAEEHTRFRRMLSKPFTFKRVEGLRPAVQKIADDRIDALLAGPNPGDVVSTVALPVPSLVISEMLGVPYEDADFFQEQAQRGTGRYATEEDTAQGAASLAKYIAKLIRAKMVDPSEDLVSDLAERVNAEELSVREATQLALGVLIAGHETTANMLSLSVAALLDHPDQRAVLCEADDPKAIAIAVEELMRFLSIIQTGQRRIAVEDIEVGGETIRAGEGIILDVAPANWDPRRFPNPDRLDLTREDGAHVGFGYGRHQCVGQQLARMELQIVLPTLLRRIPTLRLAVRLEDLPFKHDSLAYGVYELPVTW